jgi:hypothetical protein
LTKGASGALTEVGVSAVGGAVGAVVGAPSPVVASVPGAATSIVGFFFFFSRSELEEVVPFDIIAKGVACSYMGSGKRKSKKENALCQSLIAAIFLPLKTTIEIPLTQGKVTIIDAQDAERVLRYKWHAERRHGPKSRTFYAVTTIRKENGKQTGLSMHRFILQLPPRTPHVDHRNGDGLDNRRENLRLATPAQNNRNVKISQLNTSGFKGVSWRKRDHRWRAQIQFNGHVKHLGHFQIKEEAAAIYDKAARELFGEFARPNGIPQ